MLFLQANLEKQCSLENDQIVLSHPKSDLTWATKMSLVYRIEKKKIIRNQLELISFVKAFLKNVEELSKDDNSLREFLLQPTAKEVDDKKTIEGMDDESAK